MFTDIYFVFLALPVLFILLKAIPARAGKRVLVAAGLILYILSAGWLGLTVILITLVNYGLHSCMASAKVRKDAPDKSVSRAKKTLWLISVIFNSAVLICAKLSGYMPLGISFYTFQMISLLTDARDEELEPVDFCLMAMFFPKLIMGPLVRYRDIKKSLRAWPGRKLVTWDCLESGLKLYTAGLFLKVVLADNLATLWNSVMVAGVYGLNMPSSWLGAICYSLELYFDFWGYSLMAMACGTIFGIPLPANFREPYSALSVGEFWRRWHITLGQWFRDYVYIPLGGSRRGSLRTVVNLFAVWLLTGLWHGITPNFIIWSMFLFCLILLERFTPFGRISEKKLPGHLYLIFVIVISWVMFAITDVKELGVYLLCMFGIYQPDSEPSMQLFIRLISTYWYLIAAGCFFVTPVPRYLYRKYSGTAAGTVTALVLLGLSTFFMVHNSSNVFMYYSF